MENVLEQALPKVTETIEAAPALPPVEPKNNNLRDAGIVVAVVVAAAVCLKLYKCTAKKQVRTKKPLKDPNAKGPLEKFAPIFAVVGLSYALINGGFSILVYMGSEKKDKELQEYIGKVVDREIMMRFPQTSGPVLRTQTDNKLWTDFVDKNKSKNGNTSN